MHAELFLTTLASSSLAFQGKCVLPSVREHMHKRGKVDNEAALQSSLGI